MNTTARLTMSLSLAVALAACGGGGGAGAPGDPPRPIQTVVLTATLTFGGGCVEVRQNGTVVQPPAPLYCTDYGVNEGRVIFTFFVGAGEDREVVSAKLRLAPTAIDGDPTQLFTNGFVAERVDIQGPFDGFDYDAPAIGPPSPMGPVAGGITENFLLDVTGAVRTFIGSGNHFLYVRVRLDHLIPGNQTPIGAQFYLDANTQPFYKPTLVLELR